MVRNTPFRIALFATMAIFSCVLVVELVLRIAVPPWDFLDPRTDAFWATRLRGLPVPGRSVNQRDVEFDPQLGWRMRRSYASSGAHHDSRGFRIHDTAATDRSGTRIFMIGDSFTYGLGVRDDETMAAQFHRMSGAEVTNAGVNSFGVDQAYLMWHLEGRRDPVDVVVLGYYVDDFYRNLLSVREAPKPHLVREDHSYRFSDIPVQTIDAWLATAEIRASLRILDVVDYLVRNVRGKLGWHDSVHAEAAARSRHLLLALRESVAASGARLVVMVIPHCWQGRDLDASWAVASIRETCSSARIPVLDLTERNLAPDLFGENCHWNARGHRLAAEKLFAMLGANSPPATRESRSR